jgi:putative tryptophan/tyrosine transport system substrate-binding protein
MKRRTFVGSGLAVFAVSAVTRAWAQQKIFRVGLLVAGGRTPDGGPAAPLRQGLLELGYVEGKNVTYEVRFAEGRPERLPALAEELVRLKVDAIVAQGGRAQFAAKQATSVIPIVTAPVAGDLVGTGLIASLARPGGNVTGLSDDSVPLSAKRMELLKEAVPKAASIVVLWNADDKGMTLRSQELERAARILKVDVRPIGVRSPDDFAGAFADLSRRPPDAVFVVADALTVMNRKQIIEFLATQRIPAMYEASNFVSDGGLMSYGPSAEEMFRRAAAYLDRIFKGAKPSDLPAELPTRYYLTVNLKAAQAMGLTIPPVLLLRADNVVK